MYIRFVVDEIDQESGVALGVFQAMYRLSRAGKLAPHEAAWWDEIKGWFNRKLQEPARLSRSRRPGYVVYEDRFQVAAELFVPECRHRAPTRA
mgnify:CR=1 FL=1|jgi:hypothetical protein